MTAYTKLPRPVLFSSSPQELSQFAKAEKARYKQFLQVIEAKRRERNRAYWKKRRLHARDDLATIV